MKVIVLGTRGIPDIPGGVESHCQELYPRLSKLGHDITVVTRKSYVGDTSASSYKGIALKHIFSPKNKGLEAIVHSFLGVCYARSQSPDILHIHAVGPALLAPFARLLGLKVVFTNHGPDYDRDKWGALPSAILRLGEKMGGLFANQVIVISEVIREIIRRRCKRDSALIYNGVVIPEIAETCSYLQEIGVEKQKYLLAVARFVPEKGLHDLIEAYNQISDPDYKLVLAGDADHEDNYSRQLKQQAASNPNIVLTGYIKGEALHQIFSHARLFVLPSYHEGLPIALLEALSYGLTPLVSDIPANLEVKLDKQYYFGCKNVAHLRQQIEKLCSSPMDNADGESRRELVRTTYNWDTIAEQTAEAYALAASNNKKAVTKEGKNNEQLN